MFRISLKTYLFNLSKYDFERIFSQDMQGDANIRLTKYYSKKLLYYNLNTLVGVTVIFIL